MDKVKQCSFCPCKFLEPVDKPDLLKFVDCCQRCADRISRAAAEPQMEVHL